MTKGAGGEEGRGDEAREKREEERCAASANLTKDFVHNAASNCFASRNVFHALS